MSSLAKCLARAGKAINRVEARLLREAADRYREEGFEADKANEGAVNDVLRDLEDDLGRILEQAPPPAPKVPTPDEIAAQRAEAEKARLATEPRPADAAPIVPSAAATDAAPGTPEAAAQRAAADLQAQNRSFSHGRVMEGEPTVDLRNLEITKPEDWVKILEANLQHPDSQLGASDGNRADTRIAVAIQGPDERVVVAGLVRPQRILNERGVYDINALSLQRMGAKEEGKRVIRDGGDSSATVAEVVANGWRPLAVLHFNAEPGKIFDRFTNQGEFDKAWGASQKAAGRTTALPHAAPESISARRTEAQIYGEIDKIGRDLEHASGDEKDALTMRAIQLYDELDRATRSGQSQTGDTDIGDVVLRQNRQDAQARDRLPVEASRAAEFNAVVARLGRMGGRVDLFAKEFFQQGSANYISQQIAALRQKIAGLPAGARPDIERAIALREQRLTELQNATGVQLTPWHIALAMEDVQDANPRNLVSLIHEVGESLGQRLNPTMRGRISRAVDGALADLRARAQSASERTGVPVAKETSAIDLLSETLAQKLTAEGIPDAPSLAQAIVRWVKDLYYRTAMAAQRAFGIEPDAQTALDWFENQMRREVGGDYDYRIGSLLDRFLPQPNAENVRRYTGRSETPGGVVDYLDPLASRMSQPWVEPIYGDALNWNVAFRQNGDASIGGADIPEAEARARIDAASINEILDFATKLHAEIGAGVEWDRFWKIVGRGEDPKLLIGSHPEDVQTAKIGGERMTETMDGLARLNARIMAENLQFRALRERAKSMEAVEKESARVSDLAKEVNKIEGDRRQAEVHDETLKAKAKELVSQLVRDYRRGLDTAQTHGALAEAVRSAEGLLESDPIPEQYQKVFKSIADGDVSVFDYIKAIARLDLPISDLSTNEIVKAIKDNAAENDTLKQLSGNRALSVALATLAKRNADQVDEIQLGWLRDAEQYRIIHEDLQSIRKATPEQLRQLIAKMDERRKAVGLRERIKLRYLQRRRALRTAQERIDRADERIKLLNAALPRIAEKVDEMQKSGSTAPSEWYPREGAKFTALAKDADGKWSRQTRTLRFGPDGSAVDSAGVKRSIATNLEWLRDNKDRAGGRFYESVKRQTTELAMLDLQQKYHIGWTSRIDRVTQTLVDEAQKMGRGGEEAARQLRQFHLITRSHREEAQTNAHWWTKAFQDVGKSAGIEDWGKLHEQLYNPIQYFLNTNPGLEEAAALRHATRMARARLDREPGTDFNERFADLLRRTKTQSEFMMRTGEQYGSWTKDPRLKSELRRAVAQGWTTTPRSVRGDLVMTIVRDMEKAGWRLTMKDDQDSKGQIRKRVVRASTFDDLSPEDASQENTQGLDTTLQRYFTPDIVQRWLAPFLNKGGAEIFKWAGDPIPQADVQSAWDASGNSILRFIDKLSERVKLGAREDEDPLASFRLSILRQLDGLFGMEAKVAYDSSQVRNLFDPMGAKPHLMMDARLNDLLPPEHLEFAWFDPKSSENMLATIAFHAAFGRNGERMVSALNDMRAALQTKKQQYQSLSGTTRSERVAEAAARGWDYKELERGAQSAARGAQYQQKVESLFGFGNPSGPFNDLRGGLELVRSMASEIVDLPKVGLYNVLQLLERPFAQRSLGPLTVRASAGAMKDFLKTGVGSMLEALNLHLLHASEYEKEVGAALGINQRNLPWDVTVSDIGRKGAFQETSSDRWLIRPLRMLRYLQNKGVKVGLPGGERDFPRAALIPGLGVMNSITQMAAMANGVRNAKQMELFVKRGIDYFSTHKEDAQDPTFRFAAKDLGAGRLDHGVFDWFRSKAVEYGMGNLEDIVRDAMPRGLKGERLLTKDQVLRLSQMAANELDGESSIATTPSILHTNPILKIGLPLLRWPIWKMHYTHEGLNSVDGMRDYRSVIKGLGALAMWNLPLGIAFSFMMDAYDEKLTHKKSALPRLSGAAGIPVVGPALALATSDQSIPEDLVAFLDRSARAGNVYGLGQDVVAQFAHPMDPSTGQRQFSLDQRVLAMSQFLNFQQAMRNLVATDWTDTWSNFWRPFMMSVGGNGVIHSVDILNNALGLDNAESRTVMRINASNWLRAGAREAGIEVRGGSAAQANLPTPVSVWTREMLMAAMANDRPGFMQAHQNALEASRRAVADDPRIPIGSREKEAEDRVRQSWKSRDPLEVFRFRPTPAQMAQVMATMDDSGRQDVRDALARFDQFSALITPSAVQRSLNSRVASSMTPPRAATTARSNLVFAP